MSVLRYFSIVLAFAIACSKNAEKGSFLPVPTPSFLPLGQHTPDGKIAAQPTPAFTAEGSVAPDEKLEIQFVIDGSQILFLPTRAVSIAIYEGSEKKYAKVLVEKDPVAFIAAVTGCAEAQGLCLASPLQKSECTGCANLNQHQTYVAFLVTRLFQPPEEVLATEVVFR